jgi:hypothetical protein
LEITEFVMMNSIQGDQIGIWTPSLSFPDATNLDIEHFFMKLFPGQHNEQKSTVQLFSHYVVTFIQPSFNYRNYPNDVQTVVFRFFSFALSSEQIRFIPINNRPDVSNALDARGAPAITFNPVWTYLGSSAQFGIQSFAPGLRKFMTVHDCS